MKSKINNQPFIFEHPKTQKHSSSSLNPKIQKNHTFNNIFITIFKFTKKKKTKYMFHCVFHCKWKRDCNVQTNVEERKTKMYKKPKLNENRNQRWFWEYFCFQFFFVNVKMYTREKITSQKLKNWSNQLSASFLFYFLSKLKIRVFLSK